MNKILLIIIVVISISACSDEENDILKAEEKAQEVCNELQKELNEKKSEGLSKDDWNNFLKGFNKKIPERCTIMGNGRILY